MGNQNVKHDIIRDLEENASRFTAMSDEIWAKPELAWKEFTASRLQADFLEGRIGFLEIVETVSEVMKRHEVIEAPDLDDILKADLWARREAEKVRKI